MSTEITDEMWGSAYNFPICSECPHRFHNCSIRLFRTQDFIIPRLEINVFPGDGNKCVTIRPIDGNSFIVDIDRSILKALNNPEIIGSLTEEATDPTFAINQARFILRLTNM